MDSELPVQMRTKRSLPSDLYSPSTTSWFLLLTIVLLIIPSILFALFDASAHCLDGLALLCMITPSPRSLHPSATLKFTPPMSYLNFLLPFPKCITEHLSTIFFPVGPSIKYVTLFLAHFDPPSPCHTLSHIPGPPKVRKTYQTPPPPFVCLAHNNR